MASRYGVGGSWSRWKAILLASASAAARSSLVPAASASRRRRTPCLRHFLPPVLEQLSRIGDVALQIIAQHRVLRRFVLGWFALLDDAFDAIGDTDAGASQTVSRRQAMRSRRGRSQSSDFCSPTIFRQFVPFAMSVPTMRQVRIGRPGSGDGPRLIEAETFARQFEEGTDLQCRRSVEWYGLADTRLRRQQPMLPDRTIFQTDRCNAIVTGSRCAPGRLSRLRRAVNRATEMAGWGTSRTRMRISRR